MFSGGMVHKSVILLGILRGKDLQNSVSAVFLQHQLASVNPDAAKTAREVPIRATSTESCTKFREEPRSGTGFAWEAGFGVFSKHAASRKNVVCENLFQVITP